MEPTDTRKGGEITGGRTWDGWLVWGWPGRVKERSRVMREKGGYTGTNLSCGWGHPNKIKRGMRPKEVPPHLKKKAEPKTKVTKKIGQEL